MSDDYYSYTEQLVPEGRRVFALTKACELADDRTPAAEILAKAQAFEAWLKDAAPSDELRRWYGHDPRRWDSFAAKYRAELAERTDLLHLLDEMQRRGRVTLIYGARDTTRNNAVVLRDVLKERHAVRKRSKTDSR